MWSIFSRSCYYVLKFYGKIELIIVREKWLFLIIVNWFDDFYIKYICGENIIKYDSFIIYISIFMFKSNKIFKSISIRRSKVMIYFILRKRLSIVVNL